MLLLEPALSPKWPNASAKDYHNQDSLHSVTEGTGCTNTPASSPHMGSFRHVFYTGSPNFLWNIKLQSFATANRLITDYWLLNPWLCIGTLLQHFISLSTEHFKLDQRIRIWFRELRITSTFAQHHRASHDCNTSISKTSSLSPKEQNTVEAGGRVSIKIKMLLFLFPKKIF